MSKVHVVAKRDFLESLTVARPLVALAELVWNGFDAESERVQIHLEMNRMGGLQTIRVRDFGNGINHAHVEELFGSLGDSWKKKKARVNGRALHGKSGKGRFRAFALGTLVDWNTTFRGDDGESHSYRIRGQAITLDDFDIFDPVESKGAVTGTEVVISNLKHDFGSLVDDSAPLELAKLFAAYLTEYPGLILEYNGARIDPKSAQTYLEDYHLGDVELSGGRKARVAVSVVEWNINDLLALGNGGRLTQTEGKHIQIEFEFENGHRGVIKVYKGRNRNLSVNVNGDHVISKIEDLSHPFSVYVPGLAGIAKQESFIARGQLLRAVARGDANLVLRNVLYALRSEQAR